MDFQEIAGLILGSVTVATILGKITDYLISKISKKDVDLRALVEKVDNVEEVEKVILTYRIKSTCKENMAKGWIEMDDLSQIRLMKNAGDRIGIGKDLCVYMEAVERLPKREAL